MRDELKKLCYGRMEDDGFKLWCTNLYEMLLLFGDEVMDVAYHGFSVSLYLLHGPQSLHT